MTYAERVLKETVHLYKSKLVGRARVRCRSCGRSGDTSRRFVGLGRSIDQCGDCRRAKAR